MPLYEFVTFIETLRRRINDHGPTLEVSETRTRVALIDPLLQVLGWDTTDPSIVMTEYDVSGRKADYALLGQNSLPTAIVEAKRLGEPLQSHLEQMNENAERVGVKFAGITDGDRWELYGGLPSAKWDGGRMLSLRISTSPSVSSAIKLMLLWRPNLASGQVDSAGKPIESPASAVDPLPPRSDSVDWTPLSKFVPLKTTKRPEFIRFPDSSAYRLQAWYGLVLHTVEWLWAKGLIESVCGAEFSTEDHHWFHQIPVHPSGRPFLNPQPATGTQLIIEARLTKFASAKRAKALLSGCGQDLSRIHLGVKRK